MTFEKAVLQVQINRASSLQSYLIEIGSEDCRLNIFHRLNAGSPLLFLTSFY